MWLRCGFFQVLSLLLTQGKIFEATTVTQSSSIYIICFSGFRSFMTQFSCIKILAVLTELRVLILAQLYLLEIEIFLALHSNNMAICVVYLDCSALALSVLNALSPLVCCVFGCFSCSWWPFLKFCILIPLCHIMTSNAACTRFFSQVARMNRFFEQFVLCAYQKLSMSLPFLFLVLYLCFSGAVFFWWEVCVGLVWGFFCSKTYSIGQCLPFWVRAEVG